MKRETAEKRMLGYLREVVKILNQYAPNSKLTLEEREKEGVKSLEHNLILNYQQYDRIKDLLSKGVLYGK